MEREKIVLTRVSDEEHKELKSLADREQWSISKTLLNAVQFYLKARGYLKEN